MSEETQESGMSGIKKTLVGLAGAIATAVGGYVVTHIEAIFGGEEETKTEVAAPAPAAAAPVIINLENNNTNQQKQTAAPQVIRERVIEKPAAAPVQAAPVKPAPAEEEDPW